jgi:hypothetical protein
LFFADFSHADEYIGNISFSKIDWLNRTAERGVQVSRYATEKTPSSEAALYREKI